MKNGVVILFPGGNIQQVDSVKDAIEISEKFDEYNIEDFCKEYGLEYDDLKETEAGMASGYESGIIKMFNTQDVIEEIKNSDMMQCEKDSLIEKLEYGKKSISLEDYEELDGILETCEEINIDDYYEDV